MVVQSNLLAMNADRMFGLTSRSQNKTTEKLSSGYKINRAADDSSGLAISEKMRRQIRGLNQGAENTQDGISLCQVADGALAEVEDILQRMNELSVKAANGTNTDSDRAYIEEENAALIDEINRIGSTTSFNERLIFDGSMAAYNPSLDYLYETKEEEDEAILKKYLTGSYPTVTKDITLDDGSKISAEAANNLLKTMSCFTLTCDMEDCVQNDGYSVKVTNPSQYKYNWHKINTYMKDMSPYALNSSRYLSAMDEADKYVDTFVDRGGSSDYRSLRNAYYDAVSASGGISGSSTKNNRNSVIARAETACVDLMSAVRTNAYYLKDAERAFFEAGAYVLRSDGITSGDLYDTVNSGRKLTQAYDVYRALFGTKVKPSDEEIASMTKHGLWIQSGAEAAQGLHISIAEVNADKLNLSGVNLSTVEGAEMAINSISDALIKVNTIRSDIGAQQNRLEHTYKNDMNISENTTAAESRIRDTDMETEMVRYSNQNIISQVGMSMITQANQSNQGVLALIS